MPTTYTLISSNVLGSTAASVTFSSITSAYTDLTLLASIRTDRGSGIATDNIRLTLNGDSSAIYSSTAISGNGTAANRFRTTATSGTIVGVADASGATANTFASYELYIPNYTSTINKQMSNLLMQENNLSEAFIQNYATLYPNSTAISSITLTPVTGPNLIAGSSFYLYGIKNS
jgi:hypothetical protein